MLALTSPIFFSAQKRRVAGEDQHRALLRKARLEQRLARALHGVPGAELLALQRKPQRRLRKLCGDLALHRLRLVSDHHHRR